MMVAANIHVAAFTAHLVDMDGQVSTLLWITVAAAGAAIGLAILVCYLRNRGSISVEDVNMMKG